MQSFLNREYHKAVGQAEGRNKVIKRIKTVLDEVSTKAWMWGGLTSPPGFKKHGKVQADGG